MKNKIYNFFARCFQLILVLIPALEGLLGVSNDIASNHSTMTTVISPLLSMKNVQPEFLNSWRAIANVQLQTLAYYLMFIMEGVVGILGVISFIDMLIHFKGTHARFVQAQAFGRAACCLGVALWGIGFFVLAGDFFLAWQNPDLAYLQTSGLNYALMMLIPYILMKAFQKHET